MKKDIVKQIKWILVFIFPVIFFPACQTGKTVQRQMQSIQSELFYELTMPVYLENIDNTVYLGSVEDMATPLHTTVDRKGGKVLPFILYNLVQNKYEVTLGETSLIQPYRGFLVDAFLAQCNRSSCFDLKITDEAVLPDSALILEVKVNRNTTTANMVNKETSYIIPAYGVFSVSFSSWEIKLPISDLEISARLMQQGNCLWENTYAVVFDLPNKTKKVEYPFEAYEICIDYMAECLSHATKGIVENISANLHLIVAAKEIEKQIN